MQCENFLYMFLLIFLLSCSSLVNSNYSLIQAKLKNFERLHLGKESKGSKTWVRHYVVEKNKKFFPMKIVCLGNCHPYPCGKKKDNEIRLQCKPTKECSREFYQIEEKIQTTREAYSWLESVK